MIIDPSVIRQVSREKDIDPEKMFAKHLPKGH